MRNVAMDHAASLSFDGTVCKGLIHDKREAN